MMKRPETAMLSPDRIDLALARAQGHGRQAAIDHGARPSDAHAPPGEERHQRHGDRHRLQRRTRARSSRPLS